MSPRTPPGGPPPGDPETATADRPASYEEAVRRAFQSAESIEPARIAPRRPPGTASTSSIRSASKEIASAASSAPGAPPVPADPVDGDHLVIPAAAAEASMAAAADPVRWVAVGPGADGTTRGAGPLAAAVGPAAEGTARGAGPSAAGAPTAAEAPPDEPSAATGLPPADAAPDVRPSAVAPPAAAPQVVTDPAVAPTSRGARLPRPEAREDLLRVPGSVSSTADDFFGGLVRRVERRR